MHFYISLDSYYNENSSEKKSWRKNQNKHVMITTFSPENRVFREIMVKNMVQPDRLQVTTSRGAEKIRFVCGVTKARILTSSHNM